MPCRPAPADVQAIRAAFVAQGTSLTAWCAAQGLHRPNVMKALSGEWAGPKAEEVRAQVFHATGGKGIPQ